MLLATALALTLGQTCAIEARWLMPVSHPLRLKDGTQWATLSSSDVDPRGPRVWVVLDELGDATGRIKANGLEVTFHSHDFPVTTAGALVFAEVFTTSAATPLRVLRVRGDEVDVVPAPREDVEPAGPWTPATVRCEALALGRLGPVLPARGTIEVSLGVSSGPGKPPQVVFHSLSPRAAGASSRRPSSITAQLADGARLSGWTTDGAGATRFGEVVGHSFRCLAQREQRAGVRWCDHALRLAATREGRLENVATLDPGIRFFTGKRVGGRVAIELEQPWLELLEGWSLTVDEAALRACGDRPDGRSLQYTPEHLKLHPAAPLP